ncbi:hypothetical protein BS47DRAFT_1354238, partial [Hydnum rufescens UP504]
TLSAARSVQSPRPTPPGVLPSCSGQQRLHCPPPARCLYAHVPNHCVRRIRG